MNCEANLLIESMQKFNIRNMKKCTVSYVKKEYKRLALIHHPDKQSGTKEKFQKLQMYKDCLLKKLEKG